MYKALNGKLKQDRVVFDNLKVNKFMTDDSEFVKEFEHLNGNIDNPRNKKYYSDKYGGYGPVVGLMLKGDLS